MSELQECISQDYKDHILGLTEAITNFISENGEGGEESLMRSCFRTQDFLDWDDVETVITKQQIEALEKLIDTANLLME